MFGIMSRQPVYLLEWGWRFNAAPNGDSEMTMLIEDTGMHVTDVIIDREHSPEISFSGSTRERPMYIKDGGKLEYYYDDDYSDSVTILNTEMTYLYQPPVVHG